MEEWEPADTTRIILQSYYRASAFLRSLLELAQWILISVDKGRHKNGQNARKTAILADAAIAPRGFEPLEGKSQSTTKQALTENENPVLSTGLDNLVQEFPDLALIVKAWPDLPEDTRTAIKALVEKHKSKKK